MPLVSPPSPLSTPLSASVAYRPVDAKSAHHPASWRDELRILSGAANSAESGLLAEARPTDSSEEKKDPTKKREINGHKNDIFQNKLEI